MPVPFRVGFVTGATPDKWARTWRDRSRDPLELVPVEEDQQERLVRSGEVDVVLARLPVDRDGLHCIKLYEERVVAVVGHEHVATVVEEVGTEDLADEQLVAPHVSGWTPRAPQLDWPPMSTKEAVETVAAGTGVLLVPMSVARLHQRKDVTYRPVHDLEGTTVGLVWRTDNEDPRVQTFIGIVRGRTANSSRG
ncbi:LysR family transcriptional regulator [Nocardioides sp. OK12]|uniref:LysR family substrate-binding domain-containing protein n=1 Tax=Nocardioides TaxID=1839 RepID=UPI0021C408FF|nr:LysR family substrate-binding domain-containing protein [Nocardioides sp. OK12]GHJ60192.1 LysR family transcriptional regulator [Nocardioides sp. OK12]